MGAKREALAEQFEAKAREAMAILEGLSEDDWKKVTAAEGWSVGVTAHHLGEALKGGSGMVKAVAAGQSLGNFRLDMLDEMNARHAKDHADCTRAETIALQRQGAAAAAIRGLGDEQLAKSAVLGPGGPTMTVEQLDHFGSIRRTVGH